MKRFVLKEQSFYTWALVIICIGLLAASFVLTPRLGLEAINKTVAQAVCHRDCYELIKAAGKHTDDIQEYFDLENDLYRDVKDAGVNTIVIHDATLERLARTGAIELEIYLDRAIAKETHEHIFDELVEVATRRWKKQVNVYGESPNRSMEIIGSTVPVNLHDGKLKRAMQQLPMGVMSHEIKRFAKLGFNIVVAPENYWGIEEKDIDILWERINQSGANVVGVMHAGYQMFGYSKYIKYMAKKMGSVPLIMQESWTQLGFFPLQGNGHIMMARYCDYNVIRAFTIDYYEMQEIDEPEALRRWAIADDERNIRFNIVTPFLKGSEDLLQKNIDYIKGVTERVKKRGFTIGVARPMETYFPNRFLLIPVIAAIMAGVILLCQLLFGWGVNKALLLWGMATGIGVLENFIAATTTHQVMALLAGIVFPVLATYKITDMLDDVEDVSYPKIIANIVICLILCTLFSLCGAVVLSAILTDARFLLEIDYYRGVKLTFVVPLILMTILYAKKYDLLGMAECTGIFDFFKRLKEFLKKCCAKENILKFIFVLAVLGIILFWFLARTGHSWDVPVPQFELQMRYWMEEHLYARPRVKEFLIGHVAFCFMVLAAHKGWSKVYTIILTVAALIGQVSLVETFCHMRSPFLMSVARAGGGLVLGLAIGLCLLLIYILYQNLRKQATDDE